MSAQRTRNHAGPRGDLAALETLLGHRFSNRALLEKSLVHSSAAMESDLESNQTFEFLGDAVLDLAVSEFLLRRHPDRAEGELTRMRASIVSAKGLAEAASVLDLGRWIRLGRGEARSGGSHKANILADTYEAIVAAVFLDAGYEAAKKLIDKTFAQEIAEADPVGDDWKTELQELTQGLYHCAPNYALVSATGPDHEKHFVVAIRIAGEAIARGEGSNRKSAEQMAAEEALTVLRDHPEVVAAAVAAAQSAALAAKTPRAKSAAAKTRNEAGAEASPAEAKTDA